MTGYPEVKEPAFPTAAQAASFLATIRSEPHKISLHG